MADDRLRFVSREQYGAYRSRRAATKAHTQPERQTSVPTANTPEQLAAPQRARHRQPILVRQSLAHARWIAESDPRVAVIVARRDVVVSVFVSPPHSLSGCWAMGVRYMTNSRGGMELLVSAVVDLFADEIISLATFEPLASTEAR
ncbi:MAG TPA: hypothetical protein VIQ74_01670 [Gemmatimonadaceae bacterium]